jgi:hypothetical protein
VVSAALTAVSSVDIRFGGFSAPYAHLELSKAAPALSLQIEGGDETQVEGTFSQMVTELDRGSRKPDWVSRPNLLPVLAGAFTVGIFLLWAALLNLIYHLHWIRQKKDILQAQETAVLAVAALLSFLICAGTFWLFPDLELLPAGKRTRWTRFRGAALATLGAITVGLIVSLLTAIVKG